MTKPVASRASPKTPWVLYAFATLAMAAIGWFYLWTASPAHNRFMGEQARSSYYNLLVAGMLKGQLALDVPDDPVLAASDDPYNPANRIGRGMHDASYYKGKFYIYFGVTPVLILFLPFRLLTGTYLAENFAVALFAFVGLIFAWMLLRAIVRRYFPATPGWVQLLAIFCLGLGNMIPPLLRRPHMWEVTIACAYALFMVTLWLVWQALHREKSGRWLAAASLTMGLAIGARPVYLLAAVVLLIPLLEHALNHGRAFWRTPSWRKLALATLGPISAVGIGLCLYNYLRFESPFEFGQAYQLSGTEEGKLDHFSLRYVPFNFQVYLLSVPGLSWYFPFLTTISAPPVPAGQFGIENPYGMLPGMPWVIFAGATLLFSIRQRDTLSRWCLGVATAALLTMGLIFCFGGTTGRYQVDFTPGIVLLASLGVAWLISRTHSRLLRMLILLGATGLAAWSVSFNILISMQHNRLLQQEHPDLYNRVATRFNHLSYWKAKSGDRVYGPVSLRMTFPAELANNVETIVATGHEFLSDFVYVQKLGNHQIRFGFEHTSRGGFKGEAVTITPGQEYTIVVQMGSLHPPLAHPSYAGLPPEELEARTQHVKVTLDGRTVLFGKVEFYDSSGTFTLGSAGPNRPRFMPDFSGKILAWRHVDPVTVEAFPPLSGRLHLRIVLPPFSTPRSFPLLSSGIRGRGDVIYLRQINERSFILGHDHWGDPTREGAPIEYEPGRPLDLNIYYPPLLKNKPGAPLVIRSEGKVLHQSQDPFHPTTVGDIAVGWNKIGSSSSEFELSVETHLREWKDPEALDAYPATGRIKLTLTLPPFTGERSYPVLSSGKTGGGDLIFLRHIAENRFVIGHDFWGNPSTLAEPFTFDPSRPIELEITYPPALPQAPETLLTIRSNDRMILQIMDRFHPTTPEDIWVGANRIGASTADRIFSGVITHEWLQP